MPRRSANRKLVTCKDVRRVQALIEYCLTQNMIKEEAIDLISQLEIEPNFIKLVWQKLEEENQDFFKFYYAKLAWNQEMLLLNMFSEEGQTSNAPLPTFDGSHNPTVSSQTSNAPLPTFDGSHNPTVSSQANHNVGLTTMPSSFPTFDGSHNPTVSSQANHNVGLTTTPSSFPTFDELHNCEVLPQPNTNGNLTEVASFPSFDGSHNLADLSQPNSNVGLTEIAPFPTFNGSYKPMVLSQPNFNTTDLPPLPECIDEQTQASLMPTNMEHPIYSSSCDVFNNYGLPLQTSMQGDATDVLSGYGNDNWINGPSSMLSNLSEDMSLIQKN